MKKNKQFKFGSVCSGIEAATLAFDSVDIKASWFSEIEDFPSSVLEKHYPNIKNYGDMNNLPELILSEKIEAPDILCGGTPCQAFSLAGWRQGLIDERGQLTLKFIEIADSIDTVRIKNGQKRAIVMWENVEGVLKDKTNAFGCFLAGLAGLEQPIENIGKWTKSGVLYGKSRNIGWRVLDSKYFGVPQQRRRLYVIATDIDINPELILFEKCNLTQKNNLLNLSNLYSKKIVEDENLFDYENTLMKIINGEKIEFFRDYTDCLYSAYGTKWNGNAAAYNGSLFISQNDKIRRLTPLECERLMGFPDNYTLLSNSKDTSRYKAIGNSWAIQTVEWIAQRIRDIEKLNSDISWIDNLSINFQSDSYKLYLFKNELFQIEKDLYVNSSLSSNQTKKGDIFNIVDLEAKEKFYISVKASNGILRRKKERNLKMNIRLENLFINIINSSFSNTENILEERNTSKIFSY